MATLPPSRLKDVADAANFVDLTADNFTVLAEEVSKRVPTYVSGSPNAIVGPPTSGAHIELELWRDSLGGEFRCTVAGTPGTWRQIRPAVVTSFPVSPPTGYWVVRSDEQFAIYVYDGATWDATGAVGPQGPPGSLWYDTPIDPPDGALAGTVVGDWALHASTGKYYEKTGASTWTFRGSLKGEPGGVTATTFFFDDTTSDVGSYTSMLKVPDVISPEEEDSVSVTSAGGRQLIHNPYITEPGIPEVTFIEGGVWEFDLYCRVDNATGDSRIEIDVFKRTSGGTETLLFTFESDEINELTLTRKTKVTVQGNFILNSTDRLVFKVYGKTTSGAARTIYFAHNGTTNYSHLSTPIVSPGPTGPPGPQGDPGPAGPAGGTISLSCDRTTTKAGATGPGVPAGGTAGQSIKKVDGTDYNTTWADAPDVAKSARTYYVSTTGNDSNDGLTVGTPFLTIQKAVDVAGSVMLAAGLDITIQLADGTYTLNSRVILPCTQGVGANIYIQGNVGTPANVVIQSGSAIGQLFVMIGANSSWWFFRGMTFQSSHNVSAIRASYGGRIQFSNVVFGSVGSGYHLYANIGGHLVCAGPYSITGGAGAHLAVESQGIIIEGSQTVTITGTPAFSTAFAYAVTGGTINSTSMTFSGSATGVRYNAATNAVINTAGGGANFFPGNSAGTTATGGQYA